MRGHAPLKAYVRICFRARAATECREKSLVRRYAEQVWGTDCAKFRRWPNWVHCILKTSERALRKVMQGHACSFGQPSWLIRTLVGPCQVAVLSSWRVAGCAGPCLDPCSAEGPSVVLGCANSECVSIRSLKTKHVCPQVT